MKLKRYFFDTFKVNGDFVERYIVEAYHIKEAQEYAKLVIANSNCSEYRNDRIRLHSQQPIKKENN